ncbi:MAG: epimerase [Pelagibacteraceae bacterium]|mgnify:CR=1 FL=1|nr:epimerase [Pelagibacteraceae bacterium]|tara:strand:- start:4084 stop:5091 length:1008 start_codon:yes stop_codon:yes gene_type:complete
MSKIFISGIAGFIGSHLSRHYAKSNHSVVGCDNLIGGYIDNVNDDAEFHQVDCKYLNGMNNMTKDCDYIFHTACNPHEGLSVFSPHLVCNNLVNSATSVFSAAVNNKVKRIYNFSSMARYGDNETPFTEDQKTNPKDPYAIAKVAAEEILKVLSDVHEIEYVNLVPHNVIGPYQKYDDPFRNVVAIMINRMLQGKQPYIYGDGKSKRCFSDVRDLYDVFDKLLIQDNLHGETFNIGPDEEPISINELAELIAETINFPNFDPIYAKDRPREVQNAFCSSDKIRKFFGYKTKYKLKDSIEFMAEWISKRGTKKFKYHLNLDIKSEKTPETWNEKLL